MYTYSKLYLLVFFILFTQIVFGQSAPDSSKKIGLTLSGGGARGLAHIGILKAIDSAGLKIDYITGTSMGSVIGGLYSAGYSADSIEKIARSINWDILLSNHTPLNDIIIEEKFEYERYIFEIPFYKKSFRLPNGMIESEALWLKLSELFYPVATIKDFSKLPIPFKCIGTNIENGNIVVIEKGEIAQAIRASMAIPSVFTPIVIDSILLVDGGVVHNFPVDNVKQMGADYVIGVDISTPTLTADEINSVMNVLMQISFYKDAEDIKNQISNCNLYIKPDLRNYSSGDFSLGNKIIDIGIEEGMKYYPYFKKLADSLNHHVSQNEIENRLPKSNSYKFQNIFINGNIETKDNFILGRLNLDLTKEESYTAEMISEAIKQLYGTRYYRKMTYQIKKNTSGANDLYLAVKENSMAFLKGAIHYDNYNNASLIGNFTVRNLLFNSSRTLATINIGEYPKLRFEHFQYFGKNKTYGIAIGYYGEDSKLILYDNTTYRTTAEYNQFFQQVDLKLQASFKRKFILGVSARRENIRMKPKISEYIYLSGENTFNYFSIFANLNTLDRRYYSRRGHQFLFEGGVATNQNVSYILYSAGVPLYNSDTTLVNGTLDNYLKISFSYKKFLPISNKSTITTQLYGGYIYKPTDEFFNSFGLGGLYQENRNQINFVGLSYFQVNSSNITSVLLGYQYEFIKNVFAVAKANAAIFDFDLSSNVNSYKLITGFGAGLSYLSIIGPIDFYLTYSPEVKSPKALINIGFYF